MVLRSSLISAAALLSLTMGGFAQQTGAGKVGVISVQGAIVGTKDGQKASEQLQTKFAPKKKDLDARNTEVTGLEDQVRKGGTLMSEEKRTQMERDIDEKKRRLQRDVQDAQEEWNGAQQQLLQSLGQRMMAVIEKYAKDNGYTMILDVSNPNTPVLYASSGIDITQDIVALYDKSSANGGPATGAPTSTPGTGNAAPGTMKPTGLTAPPARTTPPSVH
ncbi:MAG: outer rane chaperone Skp (OmpH) [Bryobacterales bacterium]|jgi:outer membrane protein|nr:outer rane chaperone Skp (OmpH) [Bryobacterales bacterium]